MSRTINWHTKAIYLIVALAFVLGLAIVPGTASAQPTPPSLVPTDIAYDVKGAVHKVCIDAGSYNLSGATIDWWLEAGVEINPADVTVVAPVGPNPYVPGHLYGETVKTRAMIDNPFTCIAIRAMKRGDIHIYVEIIIPDVGSWILHTEKKWGELCCTELDVNPDIDGVQHTEKVTFPAGAEGLYEETITDMVTAEFLEVPGCVPAGHAIVHWWLFEDTDANQEWVDALMDYLAGNDPACIDDYWSVCGKYKITDPFLGGKEPWDYINDYALTHHADTAIFDWDAINPALPGAIVTPWYAWNESEDYLPGQTPGQAQAVLTVDLDMLEPCHEEKVMIVVLVSYPGGTTPQDDPFTGENVVCVEKGKKSFHIYEVTQVKTPQIRWAGEKIVLEKDWGVEPSMYDFAYYNSTTGEAYAEMTLQTFLAYYTLQEGAIGALEPVVDVAGAHVCLWVDGNLVGEEVIDMEYFGLPLGAQAVIAPLGGYYINIYVDSEAGEGHLAIGEGWSDTQVILWSQIDGEADVNAALYEVSMTMVYNTTAWERFGIEAGSFDMNGPIADHGFLVYFLEFEDVSLAEDITPAWELESVPAELPADVAVRVRGFFDYNHSHLMATTREAKGLDLNGDLVADKWLPAGRYILPDDWWLLAETEDVTLRPSYDTMDRAHLDDIMAPDELGPYDSGVRTIDPPGWAEYPCIGPLSTYQLWSTEDMWVSAATVPSSQWWLMPAWVRNTVVPNGTIDEWDAPMPQSLVIFDVVDSSPNVYAGLAGLDKGKLWGYGSTDGWYHSPFYEVEIPANWQIPPGYNWISWMRDPGMMSWYISVMGPYDYWRDLNIEHIISDTKEDPPNDQDVEAYSDNHGIAGVTVKPLEGQGYVTITATAEFPYSPKKGKYGPRVSPPIEIGSRVDLNPHFVVDKVEVDVYEEVTFDPNSTYGGTLPYTVLRWDFEGDGIWDRELFGEFWPGTMPLEFWAYDEEGYYYPCLQVTDSSIPEVVRKECMAPPYHIKVGEPPFGIPWYLEYGLDADPAAVNIWTYPTYGVDVFLADADWSMPDGLLIWYYGGPGVGWEFYKKGWGAVNTLSWFDAGEAYIGIVPTASQWNIPQEPIP